MLRPKLYHDFTRSLEAPAHMAPMAAEAAKRTDVFKRIISMYSGTATASRVSKAMSLCWPSQTSRAVALNIDNAAGRACDGTVSRAVNASVYMASPERMAAFSDHFLCTVGRPRRKGALSMMSSCIKVKL